jgi:hypothetical protein
MSTCVLRPFEPRWIKRALALVSLLCAFLVVSMSIASADASATRLYVRYCADVNVRSQPGAGSILGTLYTNQSMEVDQTWRSPSGVWYAHGFAYGYVNNWGWSLLNCFGT